MALGFGFNVRVVFLIGVVIVIFAGPEGPSRRYFPLREVFGPM